MGQLKVCQIPGIYGLENGLGLSSCYGVALGSHPGDLTLTWRLLHPGFHQPVLKDLRAGPRESGI